MFMKINSKSNKQFELSKGRQLSSLSLRSHMTAHFENGEKCDGSKIWATIRTIPAQFENDWNFNGN